LRKSPTRTPALLEAIRRNARMSTGPRTVRGKAQSCLNRLKTGGRWENIPEGQKHLTPRRKATKAQRKQSTFTFERGRGQKKKMLNIDVGSRNVVENTRNGDILSGDLSDILGNSAPVLTENANLGATRITFPPPHRRRGIPSATIVWG